MAPTISLASFQIFFPLAHSRAATVGTFLFLKCTKQVLSSGKWLIPGLGKLFMRLHPLGRSANVTYCWISFFFCIFLLNTYPPPDIFHVHYLFICILFSLSCLLNPAILPYFNNLLLPQGLCT